jgi:hypothetical protein
MKVFLSSTYNDLIEYRKDLPRTAINRRATITKSAQAD